MAKIIEFDGIVVGDIVLYNDNYCSWTPAVVQAILPKGEGNAPDLALVVLVSGLHSSCYDRARVPHGTKNGEWLERKEVVKLLEDPEKGRLKVEKQQLEALKQLEQIAEQERLKTEVIDLRRARAAEKAVNTEEAKAAKKDKQSEEKTSEVAQ